MSKSLVVAVVVVLLVALAVTVAALIFEDPTPTTWRAAIESGWPWFLGTVLFLGAVYTASQLFYKDTRRSKPTGISQKKRACFGKISNSTQDVILDDGSKLPIDQEQSAIAGKIDGGSQKVVPGSSQRSG